MATARKPGSKKVLVQDAQLVIRLPEAIITRLDAAAEVVRGEMPGVRFTRTDAARVLLTKALDAFEAERKATKT